MAHTPLASWAQMRWQELQAALQEEKQQIAPIEVIALFEQQKRLRALYRLQHADDRHALVRSDISRRFYEPTLQEKDAREAEFQQRRIEFAMQRDYRRRQLHDVELARAALLATASDAKLASAAARRSAKLDAN